MQRCAGVPGSPKRQDCDALIPATWTHCNPCRGLLAMRRQRERLAAIRTTRDDPARPLPGDWSLAQVARLERERDTIQRAVEALRQWRPTLVLVGLVLLLGAPSVAAQTVTQTLRLGFAWPLDPQWKSCGVLFSGTPWIADLGVGTSTCTTAGRRCIDATHDVTLGQSYALRMGCVVASPAPSQTPTDGAQFLYVAHTAAPSASLTPIPIATPKPLNLAPQGVPVARVTAPTGGGNHSIAIIRDGDRPPTGSTDSLRQYDTYDGANAAAEDWIGYTFGAPQTFTRVVFQEGKHFADGGWFTSLRIQVRQNGTWNTVPTSPVPVYPNVNNGVSFETYAFDLAPTIGDGIRIDGTPGGSAAFISVAELEVYGPSTALATATPIRTRTPTPTATPTRTATPAPACTCQCSPVPTAAP